MSRSEFYAFARGSLCRQGEISELGAKVKVRAAPRVGGLSDEGKAFLGRVFGDGTERVVSRSEGIRPGYGPDFYGLEGIRPGYGPDFYVISGRIAEGVCLPGDASDLDVMNRCLAQSGIGLCLMGTDGSSEFMGNVGSGLGDVLGRVCREELDDVRQRSMIGGTDFPDDGAGLGGPSL